MTTIKSTYQVTILSIILIAYLIFLTLKQGVKSPEIKQTTAELTAVKISDLIAYHLYNLDEKNLKKTIKSIIEHEQSINRLIIKDVVSGKNFLTYSRNHVGGTFDSGTNDNLESYSERGESNIVYDGLVVGSIYVFMNDEVFNNKDRFNIWYYGTIFILVILLLWVSFSIASKMADSKLSNLRINSNKFLYSFLLSIASFILIAMFVCFLLIESSERYALNRTESDLIKVIHSYKDDVEETLNIMKITHAYITSTPEFIDIFESLIITRNNPITEEVLKTKNRLIDVFKKYETLHVGKTNAFAIFTTKGAKLASYGKNIGYREFNEDVYPHFLNALKGRSSIFSIGAYFDHADQGYKGNLFFSTPIINGKTDEIYGVIISEIITDELFFPDSYKKYFQKTGEMIAVDHDGVIISRCKSGNCLGNKKSGIITFTSPPNNGDVGKMEITTDYLGNEVFAVTSWQNAFKANFIAKINVDEALTEHNDFKEALILITSGMSIFVILCIGFTLIIVRKVTNKQSELNRSLIERLGNAAEFKDNDTGMHVIRMSHYAKIVAKNYGCTDIWCEDLFTAAPMHDIGKIGIPDKILHKPGKLTESEWIIMKEHPIFGAKIIGDHSDPLLIMAKEISIAHHEKWDGSGYPYNLAKEDIPLSARIIAIADVYDALTTERPYKNAWSDKKAIELIKSESGVHFDPKVVDAFIRSIDEILKMKDKYCDIKCNPKTQEHLYFISN